MSLSVGFDETTALPYSKTMLTVIETPTFVRFASDYWNDEDRTSFITFIAGNPDAGDVVPGSGGVRKVRWGSAGRGKRGGVRVIYFNRLVNGEIWLLLVYGKSVRENIPAHVLRQIKEEIENA
jgi:hypothetical protein|nr:hypothetical protein [Ferrovum sp.]